MNERLPAGWIADKLSSLASLEYGKSPNSVKDEQGQYPIIGTSGVVGRAKKFICDETSVVIGRKGTINNPIYVDKPFWAIDTTFYCKLSENTDPKWFFYKICDEALEKHNEASGVPSLSRETLKSIHLKIPPLAEQKKIASILTSVDEVIENTQKQIDKLQDLKTATMNELLTKGIGHTEFKESELGRIPKSWEVVRLGDTGKWQGGGTPSKSNHEFWNGDIPWVSPKDMKTEYISQTEDYVSEEAVRHSSTNLINAGAILIVVRSGILKHTLPVAISRCDLTVNQDMKALSVGKNFSNLFIYHFLISQNHLVLRSTLKAGNTVESIDAQVFSDYSLPKPPLAEQLEIANVVETIASQIRRKTNKLSQTQSLKKSLMQDLLTGKVRVQVN